MTTEYQQRSAWVGIRRGFFGRCPQCGAGPLFSSYLKVAATCSACAHETGLYRADDGPAYFTILMVGHVVVAPLFLLEFVRTWPVVSVFAVVIPAIIALTLALLPRVKGAFVGVQWAVGDRGGR